MTREEAKDVFLNRGYVKVNGGEVFDGNLWRQSIVVISEWLKEQEPCDDVVSRKDVHDMLENLPITVEDKWFNWLQKACMRLAGLPSVTPKQKAGKWIYTKAVSTGEIIWSECSVCGEGEHGCAKRMKFCPNCGAKIAESEE